MGKPVKALSEGVSSPILTDAPEFDVLYMRFFPRLTRLILKRTGDRNLAEDVAQETLIRALTQPDGLDPTSVPWPWLKTVALNLATDQARKRWRETTYAPGSEDPATSLDFSEDKLVVEDALRRLPTRQRVAISLRYMEDWDPSQAASFLGLSRPAFEQLLFRARRRMRVEYGRLTQEAMGLLAFPAGLLRKLSLRIGGARPYTSQRVQAVGQLGPGILTQVGTALAAVVVGIAGVTPIERGPMGTERVELSAPRGADIDDAATSERDEDRVAAAGDTTSSGGGAGEPSEDLGEKIIGDATDPNRNVKDPEDAQISSLAFSPGFKSDQTVLAAGVAHHCGVPLCPPVLFRSTDGGESWTRLRADGFRGTQLLLPPAYGTRDDRIFAMGPAGLQLSSDGGRTFVTAALGGAPLATGSAAISPAFNSGDPTIIIGAQNLMRYDSNRRLVEPALATALPGPFEPVFPAAYPSDPRLIMGGMKLESGNGLRSAVFTCNRTTFCTWISLPIYDQVPKVRLSADFTASGNAVVFTQNALFVTDDNLNSFTQIQSPAPFDSVLDVAVLDGGKTLLVAARGIRSAKDGLYISHDSGNSWASIKHRLFRQGVAHIAARGTRFGNARLLVALGGTGIACSTDGRRWSTRCH